MPTLNAKPKRDRAGYFRAYRARIRDEKRTLPDEVKRPDELIPWLETLTLTQGEGAGGPLRLFPWEREWIGGLEAKRRRTVGLSIGRGAGKTALTGSLGAAAVAGPWAVPRGLVLIVASTFKQARVSFAHARAFMEPIIAADPERWRVLDSEHSALIEDRRTGATLEAREATPGSLHGPAPVLIIGDEPAQWQATQRDRMFSALRTSLGKVPGSRALFIGTRPADGDHWFAKLLLRSGTTYAADPDGDPFDPASWHAANPSLAHFPELLATYREEAEDAAADPSLLPGFKALRLNQGGVDVEAAVLIEAEAWQRCEVDLLPQAAGPCVLAFDLSGGDAMAAASCYWPSTGRLEALAAFPALPDLQERSRIDGADYAKMHADGDLLVLGADDERVVRVELLVAEALTRWGRPARVIADYHQLRELQTALDRAQFPAAALVTTGMGWKDGPGRIRDFRRLVNGAKVWTRPRLLMRSAFANARTVSDSMGSEKIIKGGASGRRRTARDDVAVAALLAVSEGARMPAAAPRKRRYAVA